MSDTMQVRLRYSPSHAIGIIETADFDPEKHEMIDDVPPPTTRANMPSEPQAVPQDAPHADEPTDIHTRRHRH